jgi:hypothetical protein
MISLEALCMGYADPRADFTARVHSAFTSVANLRLVRVSLLLTLVSIEQADLPQGIRFNSPPDFSFEGLFPGEHVCCQDGIWISIMPS